MTDRPRTTMKEIAQQANVSVATISRVVNNREYVRDDVRQRVLDVMRKVGYEPDHLARSMRTRATHTVGFIVRDLLDLVFAAMAQGVDTVLAENGYTMILSTSGKDAELDTQRFTHLRRHRVDGFILAISDETNDSLKAEMRRANVPIVLVDREIEGVATDAVVTDYQPGTFAAVQHLAQLGHRRIGYIGGNLDLRPGRERWRAVESAWSRTGLSMDMSLVRRGGFATSFGMEQTHQLLDHQNPPSALISGGNQISVGVFLALRDRNMRVPDDISLVSYDDTDLMRIGNPSVSVISRSLVDMGRFAAERLLVRLNAVPEQRLASQTDPITVVIPTTFESRDSWRAYSDGS